LSAISLTERFQLSRFISGEKASDGAITLNHRRIFILPTASGLGFAFLVLLLLLIAFVYDNNLAYLLAFLLASVFFISILHCFKALSGLVVEAGLCNPVFAGESAGFNLHISNPTTSAKTLLTIKLQTSVAFALEANSKVSLILPADTTRRGWQQAGTVTVSSTFPLGLFRAWSPLRFKLKVLVYPKPASRHLAMPEIAADHAPLGHRKKGVDDFYGLQSYQAGDAINHIHWKAFAKGQGLLKKQYGGGDSAEIWLDYALTPGHHVEERLSQLCRWLLDAEAAGIRYGFSLPGLKHAPDNGTSHLKKCLEALALF
jgi:uncharacterized protein (DUF58 family)